MTREEIQGYKKALENKQTELAEQIRRRFGQIATSGSELGHGNEADGADTLHEMHITLVRTDNETGLLRKIEEALQKIPKGTFGVCEACEDPIAAKRLKATPWAKHCISCKEGPRNETSASQSANGDLRNHNRPPNKQRDINLPPVNPEYYTYDTGRVTSIIFQQTEPPAPVRKTTKRK